MPAQPLHPARRAFWLRTLHRWHWISAALCLVGMLGFAITGITLNHAAQIPATPTTSTATLTLPPEHLDPLRALAADGSATELPAPTRRLLRDRLGVSVAGRELEWNEDELYISLPRPGGDGWMAIDLVAGEVEVEITERGWLAYFNDLHKGRNTGASWNWFIDVFAVACLLFALTGLCLLVLHARQRGATWPLVGLGALLPLLLLLLLAH